MVCWLVGVWISEFSISYLALRAGPWSRRRRGRWRWRCAAGSREWGRRGPQLVLETARTFCFRSFVFCFLVKKGFGLFRKLYKTAWTFPGRTKAWSKEFMMRKESSTPREFHEPGSPSWRETKGVPRKGVWTSVHTGAWACKESRAAHDPTSCYSQPPFLGTPLGSL